MSVAVCKIRRFVRQTDTAARRKALPIFAAAACLSAGVYLSELFHLLEKPLFSKVYYGNLETTFFAAAAALYIVGFFFLFFRLVVKKRLGLTPFSRNLPPLTLSRKAVLYLMTVIPILTVDALLGFRFKFISELGERITGMAALGNAVRCVALNVVAKTLAVTGFVFLVERAFDCLFAARPPLPFGGLAAILAFGVPELIIGGSAFPLLYFSLFFYYGVIYLASGRRFGTTYILSMLLCIL